MSPHAIIDKYNLTISLLITIAWQLTGFAVAWTLQFDKITDFTGGSNFFILALITLTTGGTYHARNIVASVLIMLWSARLAGFLLFRVLKTGSDTRFDEMRSHFFKFAGFWGFQIIWVWTVSLPTVILNSPAVSDLNRGGGNPSFGTGRDIAGIILFAIGLSWEALGDIQKYLYKSSKPPKGQPCTKGLWYFSRHPPYFGEIVLHWGIWILCLSPTTNGHISSGAKRAQYTAIVAPLLTMVLLLFLSGLPTAEKPTAKKYYLLSHSSSPSDPNAWDNYKRYLKRTSILIPFPPAIYVRLPEIIKRTILLDFPMYKFDEGKDGREALAEEARK
ncbi:hypothetical protein TREMEDRAFT_31874 [Tremella mesenterica DSM 1558]|uniref:uncharacterized protein n=1 Tax=Tremella mesenterica (strain ATCC 24925 / CBS 8224 / DSM 1558 / NBRC 9311 / NRRL Y-6157 / RJB 2259-6 / UBC 559-6) TaxID=578456 RepID=UPI0003F49AEE|nr:uncharacterized protein TREMEDRAFT_31874 [Tremella mesenterica DSM 1558]EIW68746.1 hypothetical protein TREMEDRAFT_31874 [Tremella mesenterica DSM 1558]